MRKRRVALPCRSTLRLETTPARLTAPIYFVTRKDRSPTRAAEEFRRRLKAWSTKKPSA